MLVFCFARADCVFSNQVLLPPYFLWNSLCLICRLWPTHDSGEGVTSATPKLSPRQTERSDASGPSARGRAPPRAALVVLVHGKHPLGGVHLAVLRGEVDSNGTSISRDWIPASTLSNCSVWFVSHTRVSARLVLVLLSRAAGRRSRSPPSVP